MAQSPADKYVPSLLQVIAVSDYKRQQPVGYFSLPAEIRNMIMELVLVPGQVLLDDSKPIQRDYKLFILQGALHRMIKTVSKHSGKGSKTTRVPQPPGFQLLATCKQACVEGHAVFYSSNIFFLQPGPLDNTHRSLKTLQPQHRAMIKKVGITMSLNDLTPAGFEEVHHDMQVIYGSPVTNRASHAQGIPWSFLVEEHLKGIWKEKLDYVLTHLEGLTLLRTVTMENSRESDAEDMAEESLHEEDDDIFWSPKLRDEFWRAAKLVRKDVEGRISSDGEEGWFQLW